MIALASSGTFVTDHLSGFLTRPLKEMSVCHIITASVPVPDTTYLQERRKRVEELGLNFQELDLVGKNEDEVLEALRDKDAVFVEGGNTFFLLKHIRESGFDKVVKKLISEGLVYIGSSAGSYVACPTIEMTTWPCSTQWDRFGITDFTGMGLVDFLVLAHYGGKDKEVVRDCIEECKYKVEAIKDNQAILVVDGETKKISVDLQK